MLKKIFYGIVLIAMVAAVTNNVTMLKNDKNSFTINLKSNEALATGESGDEYSYIITEGDCTVILTGQAGATVTVLGIKHTFPLTGTLTLTFTDVKILCSTGGSFQCHTSTCNDFWH